MGRSAKEPVVPYDGVEEDHADCSHYGGIIFDRAEQRKGPNDDWEIVIHVFCAECGASGSVLVEGGDTEW